jgi:predicted nucleic acid-binding protein
MQAYHALARRAQLSRQERESSFRVSQLRSAALATRDLGAALGEPLADYWLLQADLFDLQRLDATPHARQRRMAQRLERFVEEQARAAQLTDDKDDPTLRSLIQRLLLDAQRVLLRLADDRGDSGRASELLKEITESPAITPLESSELSDRHAGLALLGRRFDAELQLADGRTWLASERRGKTLVLLFIAQGHEASDEAAQRLLTLEPSLRVRGVEVLTVRVSTPRPAQHDQASPQIPPARLYVEQDQPVLLSRVFAVRSLPRYVVIDPKGKIKSMGASEAVISDLAAPAAPQEPATPPRAAPQPPPLPRTPPTDNDKPTQP